jgi:thiol-disulfide isomerase/thioredoxin
MEIAQRTLPVTANVARIGRTAMRVAQPLALGAVVALAGAMVLIWFGLARPADAPAEAGPTLARPGAPAPQIALPAIGGGTSNLVAERGKVVLVNFWATWCEPCKSEMPALQQLADDLRDEPFILYSVDLQEDASQVEAFQRDYRLRLYALLDESGEVTRAYSVRALPSTFLIDQGGILRQQRLGPLPTGGPETAWSQAWLAGQVRAMLGRTS